MSQTATKSQEQKQFVRRDKNVTYYLHGEEEKTRQAQIGLR